MYNGFSFSEITMKAYNAGSIFAFKDGVVTHGVLMDIPRLKGVDYLRPGTRIYPEDQDAWAKQAHLKISLGVCTTTAQRFWAAMRLRTSIPSGIEGITGAHPCIGPDRHGYADFR